MQVVRTRIPDVMVVTPSRFGDARGYFSETYNVRLFAQHGVDTVFVQDNQSLSAAVGTIRGLHFQAPPHAQAKLVRVLQGAIFDVAVDIRRGSPSYGQWVAATLTADGGEQIFVPRGFAHGFCTLTPDAVVAYKVDNYYAAASDAGIDWADETLAIAWPDIADGRSLSAKDAKLPAFADIVSPFVFEG